MVGARPEMDTHQAWQPPAKLLLNRQNWQNPYSKVPIDTYRPIGLILDQGRMETQAILPHRHRRPVLLAATYNQKGPAWITNQQSLDRQHKMQLHQERIIQASACLERVKP